MAHYIITYYLKVEEDKWERIVYVCENMHHMIGFLKNIAKHDDELLVSVEVA